jgi:hypothetical protein
VADGDKPARKRAGPKRPEEFSNFDALMRRLIRVPKPEIDEAVKRDEERRRGKRS